MARISSLRRRFSMRRSFLSRSSSSTHQVVSNLQSISNNGIRLPSMSSDSICKLTGCVGNMNVDVGKLLLASERDLRKDPELLKLTNDFFNTNSELSHLCASLKECLEKAHRGETLVHEAVSDFAEEKRVSGELASFTKTLEDLRSFKAFSADDPFAGDFSLLFRRCQADLVNMIAKLNQITKKLDKKLRRMRRRRRLSVTVFLAVIAVLAVGAVVAGVMAAPPVALAVGGLVTVFPVGGVGVYVSTLWEKASCLLKRQRAAINSMERGTCVSLNEAAKSSDLVNRLEDLMTSMGETVETATEKRSLLNFTMVEVEKELAAYQDAINILRSEAEQFDEDARLSHDVAREKMTLYLTRYERTSRLKMIFSGMSK